MIESRRWPRARPAAGPSHSPSSSGPRCRIASVIRRRVALLDRAKLNLNVTVFVAIRTNQHNPEWLERFARAVLDIPEVVDFYRMSGDIDYLLRVVVPDIATPAPGDT